MKGSIRKNIEEAKKHSRKAALAGHMPIAPHVYFTSFLNDDNPKERKIGLEMGQELLGMCDEMWIYGKPTEGMLQEIKKFKGKKVIKK